MQQTIQLGQVAQPSVLSQVKAAVESRTRSSLQQALAWWYAESRTLTALCGFEGDVFTHGDVVKAALGVLVVILILGVAGRLEGGMA